MTDGALLLSIAIAGGGAWFALRCAASLLREAGGAGAVGGRLAARHDRLSRELFAGRLGRVAGGNLADPSRSLLSGTAAAASIALLAVAAGGTRWLPAILAAFPPGALILARCCHASQGRRIVESIRRDLPGASLLLSLLLDSGLSVPAAMPEVIASIEERPLGRELAALRASLSMGGDRQEAYRRSMERIGEEEYHSFLSILQMGERTGTGLSRSLADLSHRMVEGEGHRAESRAQKAPVRLLVPLVLCFFPSVALLILSPVLLTLLASGVAP